MMAAFSCRTTPMPSQSFRHRALAIAGWLLATAPAGLAAQSSLRFFGHGVAAPGLDRVEIPLDAPARPVDVGAGDFTLELWLKALPGENTVAMVCNTGNDSWINGNILLDRDIFGPGDFGDFGISLMNRRLAFGAANSSAGATACSALVVDDGQWHHLAFTRRASDGRLRIWVDGVLDATVTGPSGNLSYRDGRGGQPKDPFLVLGAEKHDAGAAYPSFSGWLDELRVSTVERYTAAFTVPAAPFTTDASTAALYHLDEASGTLVADSSGASGGPSHGTRNVGGSPAGPQWSNDTPFASEIFSDGFENGDTSAWDLTVG